MTKQKKIITSSIKTPKAVIFDTDNTLYPYTPPYKEATHAVEENEEKLFFPLDTINERCYIYAINKEQLETDGKLFASLRDRSASMVGDETIVSVRIHSTDYPNNYGYLIANTSEIQQEI